MITIISKFAIKATRLREISYPQFNTEIIELLSQNKLVAGYDALLKIE